MQLTFKPSDGVRRVVHSVRTAAAAGATTMVLTNGAGGIKDHWKPGTPVLISDHINLTAASPLEGATFIDLTDLYSKRLRDVARSLEPEPFLQEHVRERAPDVLEEGSPVPALVAGGGILGRLDPVGQVMPAEQLRRLIDR